MLQCAETQIQKAGGQHFSSEPAGWAGQSEHGKAHVLFPQFAGETGQDRRVSVSEGLQRHLSKEKRVRVTDEANLWRTVLLTYMSFLGFQVCYHRNGSDGSIAHGLSCSRAQFIRRELP